MGRNWSWASDRKADIRAHAECRVPGTQRMTAGSADGCAGVERGAGGRRPWKSLAMCKPNLFMPPTRLWNAGCLIGPKAPMKPKCSYSNPALQATHRIASIQRAEPAVLLGGSHPQICSVCESARRIYVWSSSASDARIRMMSVVFDIKPEQHSPNDPGLSLPWVGLILAHDMQNERLPSR